jgi:signal peptidase I
MTLKERFGQASGRQWLWFVVWTILTILFSFWSQSPWVLLFILLFLDIYISKFIPWGFWKKSKNDLFRKTMEWVDAIVFALIAVYFINTFFFQNYQIPTSSLEKSLLVGDFLAVGKYLGMNEKQTLQSWTVMESIIAFCGLGFTLLASLFFN